MIVISDLLYSQTKGYQIVEDVLVEGNNTISEKVIRMSSGLVKNKKIYGEDIQNAIKKLWKLNLFSNIIIDGQNIGNNKVILKIILEEYPRLFKVRVSGNSNFDKEEIEEHIRLSKGQILKNSDIQKVKNDLTDFYVQNNYLLCNIDISKSLVNQRQAELVIKIDEGKEVLIKKITFHGNKTFENEDLIDEFEETKEDAWYRDGDFDALKYEEDLVLLGDFYRQNGFKNFEFIRDSIYYGSNKEDMFIDIWINEGPKFYFGDVRFEGNTIYGNDELLSKMEFDKGDLYNKLELDISIYDKLTSLYMDRGYLGVQLNAVEEAATKDTVNFVVKITEGSKAKIRKINIYGNTKTNEKVIRRELAIFPGDIFSRSKLIRSQRNVTYLNYFESVIPDIEKQVNDTEVDLSFKVKEKSTEQFNASIAYSESQGLIGSLGFTFNNFSFERPFRRGDGQKLTTSVEFGKKYYKYSFGVEEPWLLDTPTLIGSSVNYQKRSDTYSDTYITGATLRLGRRFKWADNYLSGSWLYAVEHYQYENVNPSAPPRYELYEGKEIWSSSITQYFVRNDRNNYNFPTEGSSISLMTKLAGGALGGDEGFHKHKLEIKWYQPLYKKSIVLCNQYLFGAMDRLISSSYIRPREYFYLGGGGLSNSEPLRGYDDESVGPFQVINGRIYYTGGRNIFKTTTELRFLIAENPMLVYVLGFFDAGNVWNNFKETNLFDLKKGAGVGLRLFVPMVGMIGFDIGYGFDHYDRYNKRRDWTNELRTHFRMGYNL